MTSAALNVSAHGDMTGLTAPPRGKADAREQARTTRQHPAV